MSLNQVNQLKNNLLGKKTSRESELTNIIGLVKELGCLPEVIGRDYEVRSPKGDLLCTITQKPMALKQLNNLLKELDTLHKIEKENDSGSGKKIGRLNNRRK